MGLKQTILFPFVTLGSLISFCDCLMAGSSHSRDHSGVKLLRTLQLYAQPGQGHPFSRGRRSPGGHAEPAIYFWAARGSSVLFGSDTARLSRPG